MQGIKQVEVGIFQRMDTLQRGCMQSELAFVLFQIVKLLFRDAFIITVFAFPLPNTQTILNSLFAGVGSANVAVSIILAFFLIGLCVFIAVMPADLQEKFKSLLQTVVPWVDVTALLIITINLQLLSLNIGSNLWLMPFNIVSVVAASLITIFYTLFNFTKEPRSKNLLKKREARVVTFCDFATLLICFYLASACTPGELPEQLGLIFSLIQLCLSLLKTKQRVFMQFYLQNFSQSVSNLLFFVELNLALLAFTSRLFKLPLLTENLYIIMSIMTVLEYAALTAYIDLRNNDMCLQSAAELKDEEQAGLYLERLCEIISKVEKEEQDIILTSLKKKHSIACKNASCFCQQEQVDFMREYVRCELQAMTELFHTSISILISVLYFKMVVFKYYPEILSKLAYYSTHFTLSLTQRYYCHALTQYVREFIRKRNLQIDAVESEHMFKLEEIRNEIEGIIRGEIQVRNKLWKYLSRGLCRVSELQHNCNISLRQISRLMLIFSQNKSTFKKSKEFNLLLLFYFVKVGFLNNGKEIKQNLKELYYGYKEDELYSLKEFKKFIYHKRSCVIETLIDTKTMGIVTGASRNVEEMFGIPQNKVIGMSINNLMPQLMGEEHELVMAEWARSGTWRTIGKLKEIFCIHKEQFCFSALIYLKIYIKENNMHFITNIFKLNDADFMVINPSLKIQGLGKKFLKILGEPAKRISLELLIENAQGILRQENYPQGKTYRRVLINVKELEAEVDGYLQSMNLKFKAEERQAINRQFHDRLLDISHERYLVEFTIRRCKMGKINFLIIGLKESKHLSVDHQTCTLVAKLQIERDNSRELLDYSVDQSNQSSFQRDDHDQLLMDHNASSSLASISEKENYPIAKTIQKFIMLVQHPDRISDRRLTGFNLLMVIFLLSLTVINFISYYCYRQMLLEIEGIFFADGAQSDIMQTTQIGYSYIYILRSQLLSNASQAEFASTLQSARLVNTYVYSLGQSNFASLITNVTQLSKDRYYSYLEQPTVWSLRNRPTPVLTHQFLQNMYYLSTRVINELEALRDRNSTQINTTFFRELFANFPEMKSLNEYYLNDYQQTSMEQHDMLDYFTISSMAVYFLLSLVLSLALNHYFKFRFDQLVRSFTFFSSIANYYLQRMKEYYAMLLSVVVQGQKLKAIDSHEQQLFQIDTYDLFHKNDNNKGSLFSKIKFINYENYYKWIFILILFCLINTINYLATAQIRNFFPNSRIVITQINELMRSQNKLLESYYSLRAAYSLDADGLVNQTLYNSLIDYLNQTDTKFNSVADKLTTVFSDYDPSYQAKFVNSLVTSVCQLSSTYLTTFQNDKCLKELTLNILDGGILITMNFFQRNTRTALEDLRTYYITKTEKAPAGDYFRQLSFIELDNMIIYMFKIYQLTQAITFNSYINTIEIITSNYLKLIVGTTAFFILTILIWLKSIPAQKRSLSYLYGHLLLIPFMILKSNTRIVSTLKEAIEYSDI